MTKNLFEIYPWLYRLPNAIIENIDREEFFTDLAKLNFKISDLEKKFKANIMIYKTMDQIRKYSPCRGQLCRVIRSKEISESSVAEIQAIEKSADKKICIVLYEDPINLK